MGGATLAAGDMIGARYRLDRVLGAGGMGEVWAVHDLATGERRALKLMKDAPDEPQARRRFLREARAASVVRHPNVVAILDVVDRDDAPPAIAMERNAIDRAAVLSQGDEIVPADLPTQVTGVTRAPDATPVPLPPAASSDERERIIAVLAQCAGNQTRAAKVLGMSLRTLVNRLAAHNIARPRKAV